MLIWTKEAWGELPCITWFLFVSRAGMRTRKIAPHARRSYVATRAPSARVSVIGGKWTYNCIRCGRPDFIAVV